MKAHKTASNKAFGLLMSAICMIIAGLHFWHGEISIFWTAFAAVLLAISLLIPRVLAPLKRLWLRLAALLAIVVGPIALGLMYVLAMMPVGLLIRLSGKDLLSLRHDPLVKSYWVNRGSSGPSPASLKDQF